MNFVEIKEQIKGIAAETIKLPHFKLFLFGSRANGKADERSDIDLGIEAPAEIPAALLFEFKEKLEHLPTLLKFDVVDFNEVGKDFKKVADKAKEVLYER